MCMYLFVRKIFEPLNQNLRKRPNNQVFPKVADVDNSASCQCNLPLKTVSTGSVSDFWKNTIVFTIP